MTARGTHVVEKVHSSGVRLTSMLRHRPESVTVSDILAYVTAAFVSGVVIGVALMRAGWAS